MYNVKRVACIVKPTKILGDSAVPLQSILASCSSLFWFHCHPLNVCCLSMVRQTDKFNEHKNTRSGAPAAKRPEVCGEQKEKLIFAPKFIRWSETQLQINIDVTFL